MMDFAPRSVLRRSWPLSAAVFLPLMAVTAMAWSETWQIALDDQLRVERQCVVTELAEIRQWELAGRRILEGRAECLDGRAFDFSRSEPAVRFDLKQCEPKVC